MQRSVTLADTTEPTMDSLVPRTGMCRNCGLDIPDELARVAGDNQDCVPACPECIDPPNGHDEVSISYVVQKITSGRFGREL
jgi:hypothetical protein